MLIILIATYFLSGFGITKSSLINKSTFGLLDKASSFRIHEYLTLPMAFAFLCHTLIAIRFAMIRWKVKNKIVLNYLLTGIGIILFSLAAYAYFI